MVHLCVSVNKNVSHWWWWWRWRNKYTHKVCLHDYLMVLKNFTTHTHTHAVESFLATKMHLPSLVDDGGGGCDCGGAATEPPVLTCRPGIEWLPAAVWFLSISKLRFDVAHDEHTTLHYTKIWRGHTHTHTHTTCAHTHTQNKPTRRRILLPPQKSTTTTMARARRYFTESNRTYRENVQRWTNASGTVKWRH